MKNNDCEWKLIAQKSIGTSHVKNDLPCQDFCDVKHSENKSKKIIIGAISDGAGSAKHAEIGSQIAVEKTLSFCNEKRISLILEKIDIDNFSDYLHSYSIKLVQYILKELVKESIAHSCSIEDFACTLIAFIASPDFVISLQIGDGFLVTKYSDNERYNLLFQPEKGEYANETTFITSKNVGKYIKTKIENKDKNLSFICASTDGLERVALNLNDGTAYDKFFQPLYNLASSLKEEEFKISQISSFLDSEKLNSRTDDDKSIILCYLPSSGDI